MIDIYVLNKSLEVIGIVDSYKSLIWANRYRDTGDCELYVPATTESLSLLRKGYYLARADDEMVCQIKYIQLDTDAENGNYLIVKGYDVKGWLDQRIVWNTMSCDGNVETFIRSMVNNALGNAGLFARQITDPNGSRIFYLGDPAGFSEVTTEQVSYKNIGEKIREYCLKYGWGYKVIYGNSKFWFLLYAGIDHTNNVIFSNEYENLAASTYIEDETNMGNVALVAGEGEGSNRSKNVSGYAESVDRYEIYVDAKDISKTITWSDLIALYPTTDQGGQGYISGNSTSGYTYKLNYLNVQIVDSDQLTWLQTNYPSGQVVTINGIRYYQVYNEAVADIPSNSPESSDNVTLRNIVYSVYLLNRGYDKLSEFGALTSFSGTIEPNTTFVYKQDYYLGDMVTVKNEFGISASARIVEVVEVNDDNGYSVEPKFEYIEINGDLNSYLLTSENIPLMTEDNLGLVPENRSVAAVSQSGISGIKISQLNEATELDESHFIPVASDTETLKVSYPTLVDQVASELNEDLQGDWEEDNTTSNAYIKNKPLIEGIDLVGDKTLEELNLKRISNSDIENILT